jgi:preprotein translocase subunit SecF
MTLSYLLGFLLFWYSLNLEVNLMFITGVLAVIGYSVNDTVIIFDRIRENRLNNPATDFATVVNNSLVETLTRSLNTGLTTMVVILALLLFIGSTIENFSIVMLIGTVTGIYSSIFIATSLLVIWERRNGNGFCPG